MPKAKWEPKTTAIEEAHDLSTLLLDDLQGKLLTHELQMNEYDGELQEVMKNLALKAKDSESSQDLDRDETEDDEDPLALISKVLARIMKFKKNNHNHRYRRRSNAPKDHKGKQFVSNKPKVMNCFECGDANHLVKDCPQKKNKNSSKWNKDRRKKAMIASWSD